MTPHRLRAAFLSGLPPKASAVAAAAPTIDPAIDEALAVARAASIGPSDEADWLRFLAGKVASAPPAEALAALHVSDLAIAWGATRRLEGPSRELALRIDALESALRDLVADPDVVAESKQNLAAALLAPRAGRPPELLDYAGRGPLAAWLRIAGVRKALQLLRRKVRHVPIDDDQLVDRFASGEDLATTFARAEHKELVARALRQAVRDLEARQRTLLRFQLVDGIGVTEIGEIYRVHRATAARWVGAARDALLAAFRVRLGATLDLESGEAESLLRLVGSQIDVSLARLLEET